MRSTLFLLFLIIALLTSCSKDDDPIIEPGLLQLSSLRVGTRDLQAGIITENVPVDMPIVAAFSDAIDTTSLLSSVFLFTDTDTIQLVANFLDQNKTFSVRSFMNLDHNTTYTFRLEEILSSDGLNVFPGQTYQFLTVQGQLILESILINGIDLNTSQRITDISPFPEILATFNYPLDPSTVIPGNIIFNSRTGSEPVVLDLINDGKTLKLMTEDSLEGLEKHTLRITENISGDNGFIYSGSNYVFYTGTDSTYKFPYLSDDELLTKIQQQTFAYFWDFAHPASGMARERDSSGDLVTTGGSGFGLMNIIVGIEHGFITRQEGTTRLQKIVEFLESAERFHGVWPHWINGNNGQVIPFSANDNGGDLVETAFLIQGLLTFRKYLDEGTPYESDLIDRITALWEEVEWDWYTQGGQDVLYWHWSPDKGWIMNHQIRGYNEALIVYILAASSPTHAIEPQVYHSGWAQNGSIENGKSYYDITLPLGFDYGGPLFFAHYSFLGLDPRNLSDNYANYWEQNINHSLINLQHCIINPYGFVGYSEDNWGLTASDDHMGYSAHSPTNDLGVISPTAAVSSLPYTPEASMKAIRFFYYIMGDRVWGPYGFYDAFNVTEGWFGTSYLAIDQGPMGIMIENHRTGLLWNLFMSDTEIQTGLDKLGFTY